MIYLALVIAISSLALTDAQVDSIIKLAGKLIDHIPSIISLIGTFLSLIGTGFLILRQHYNRRDVVAKLDENTKETRAVKEEAQAAYKEANNINLKLESLGIQTKPKPPEL